MSSVQLSQPNDEMFLRNLAIMASRGQEVEVETAGDKEPLVGYLAGLDDEFLQICTSTDTVDLCLVSRIQITTISPTGITLGDLSRQDPTKYSWVYKRVANFKSVSEAYEASRKEKREEK